MSGGVRIENFEHFPHTIAEATPTEDGVMSAEDKVKLDGLVPGYINAGFEPFSDAGSNEATVTMVVSQTVPYQVYLTPNVSDEALFVNYYYVIIDDTHFKIVASQAFNGGFSWGTI